jgi:hypothetical protein
MKLNKLFTLILFNAAKYDWKFPFNNVIAICKTLLFFDILPNKSSNGVVYPKSNDLEMKTLTWKLSNVFVIWSLFAMNKNEGQHNSKIDV